MQSTMRLLTILALSLLSPLAIADESDVQPPEPAPTAAPPPPSAAVTATPPEQARTAVLDMPAPAAASQKGQWVYTGQYGWIWMPYDRAYTYAPREVGGDPYMYAYYPAWGWRWIAAPWIFGVGPRPYFGVSGWHHYGWYGHPWFGHAWYGFRHGFPGGYRGVAYAHPWFRGGAYVGAPRVNHPGHPHGVWRGHGRRW